MYVNKKTREVTFEVNRKQVAALTTNSGRKKRFYMEQPAFDRLLDILTQRRAKKFEQIKEEMDNKADYAALKDQLDQVTYILKKQFGDT